MMPVTQLPVAAAVLVTALVMTVTGCSDGTTGTVATDSRAPTSAPTSAPTPSVEPEGPTTTTPVVEEQGPPPQVESDEPEEPAAGGGGEVSVELAGLPVGTGFGSEVDGAWCGLLFGNDVPEGVSVQVTAVRLQEPGAVLRAAGCEERAACQGALFTAGEVVACAVLVEPPPGAEEVLVRLDGVLRCPDQATCDLSGVTVDQWEGDGWTPVSGPPLHDPVDGTDGGTEDGTSPADGSADGSADGPGDPTADGEDGGGGDDPDAGGPVPEGSTG